jgi:hypothetical protein
MSVDLTALLSVPCPTCGATPNWLTLCCSRMAAVHLACAPTCRDCQLVLCPTCARAGRCAECRGGPAAWGDAARWGLGTCRCGKPAEVLAGGLRRCGVHAEEALAAGRGGEGGER